MAEVNATAPMHNQALSEGMSKANNRSFNFALQDFLMGRKPDYWVYLYSVSESSFDVYRPPLLANLHITGRKQGQDFVQCARFPQPLLSPQGSVDNDEITIMPMDTRRFVMDIINPDNLGFDQDAVIQKPSGVGNDLGKKGVFWSVNNPPTELEVKSARARMERYYNALLEKARAVETSDPKTLIEMLTPEHHAAADYFGVETSWHGKRSRPMDCPNCGDRIKVGVAFHKTEEGTLCILDWARAVKSGVRTKQQAIDAGAPGFETPQTTSAPVVPVAPKNDVPYEDSL
jgi:hypothetical protein